MEKAPQKLSDWRMFWCAADFFGLYDLFFGGFLDFVQPNVFDIRLNFVCSVGHFGAMPYRTPQPQKIVCELMGAAETPFAVAVERFVISLLKGDVSVSKGSILVTTFKLRNIPTNDENG